jgi:hypothetical protein
MDRADFPKLLPKKGDVRNLSKMPALPNVKQSRFETTLLVDPVDDIAIGGVAADCVA